MLVLGSLIDRFMDPLELFKMSPFSLLLNMFFLNAPCSWVCYYFERKKSFFWIMTIATAGLLVCSLVAVMNGTWKVLYVENVIFAVFSLGLGFWYSLRKRKKSKEWTSFDD